MAPHPDPLLTTKDLSAETGVPEATLRYWRHRDEGPASFRVGRRVVYRRAAVEEWLNAQEATTTRGGVA